MAVEWMKAKYSKHKPRGRYHALYGGQSGVKKNRRQLSPAEKERHANQPKKIMVMLPSGKTRMEIVK